MSPGLKILGIDDNRSSQTEIARACNDQGVFYRFLVERPKMIRGIRQLKPDLLLVKGNLNDELPQFVFEQLATDISLSRLPVVLLCQDTSDSPFTSGMRSGLVAMLPLPFDAKHHVSALQNVLSDLAHRSGICAGTSDSTVLARLVEHIRRTRRSGVLTFNPKTPSEGTASFVFGKLENARFRDFASVEALINMVALPSAQWRFAEVGGAAGDGAGVVIEFGDNAVAEEIAVVEGVAVSEDEPLPFEMDVHPRPRPSPQLPRRTDGESPNKLLLVDDEDALCRMFSILFQRHGFHITTANDGIEGVEAAFCGEFDAIIADLNMPRMDGWGMLRVLRDDYRTREIPVAFLSCHDDYREQLKAQDAGAQAYYSKGSRLEPLVGQVRKLLEPREKVSAQIYSGEAFSTQVSAVGPQWMLQQMAAAGSSGKIDAQDGWAGYQIYLDEGQVTHATAVAGRFTAESERAFNAFLASRNGAATFHPGMHPAPQTLNLPTEVLIERACSTLNENERRARDGLLVSGEVGVNRDLYALYLRVGPKEWLEPARLICEERATAREVISRLDASPLDVEEIMKDLIRRGVITLSKRQ